MEDNKRFFKMKKLIFISWLLLGISISNFSQNLTGENIDIQKYIIDLDITNISEKFIFGHTDVIFKTIEENVNNISLDLLKLNIDSITCSVCEIADYSYNDSIIHINFASSFNIDEEISLRVYYHGNPIIDPSGWGGFYFVNGYAFNMGVAFEDTPHSYARVWFPCKDSFTDRAKVICRITTLDNHTAVCGGKLNTVVTNSDSGLYDTKTWEWELENPVPTYLVSVAVGPYKLISHNYQGVEREIPIDLYVYPNDSLKAVKSFANIDTVMYVYENLFGAYAWERVGYVAVPFNSGAMEHVTNISIGGGFITGNLNYEDLYYHELAHMWFGNQVTCSSAEDMWLNEGWASYCETIFREFVKSKENALAYRRAAHEKVLRLYHHEDGGFYPLFPVNQDITYSNTVYQKGASVAHALRGYLGDEVFFPTISEYLKQNSYTSKSSYDLRDFITNYSGVNVNDFFQNWVFTPGFVHFSIDSTQIVENGDNFNISVFMKQKLRGRNQFANSNKVPISFMNENFETITKIMEFDGEFGEQTFTIPFNPMLILCDYFEQTSDASIKETKFLTSKGLKSYNNNFFKASIKTINENDTAMLRITHNWVAPDRFENRILGLVIANNRFWSVEGNFPNGFKASAEFTYSTGGGGTANAYLDNEFITNSLDSLVLLYRPNRATDWIIEEATNSKILKKFTVDSLKSGEYCLAIYDWENYLSIENNEIENLSSIFPNPNNGEFEIAFNEKFSGQIFIYDINGKLCWKNEFSDQNENISVSVQNLKSGLYFLNARTWDAKVLINKKIIIQK